MIQTLPLPKASVAFSRDSFLKLKDSRFFILPTNEYPCLNDMLNDRADATELLVWESTAEGLPHAASGSQPSTPVDAPSYTATGACAVVMVTYDRTGTAVLVLKKLLKCVEFTWRAEYRSVRLIDADVAILDDLRDLAADIDPTDLRQGRDVYVEDTFECDSADSRSFDPTKPGLWDNEPS